MRRGDKHIEATLINKMALIGCLFKLIFKLAKLTFTLALVCLAIAFIPNDLKISNYGQRWVKNRWTSHQGTKVVKGQAKTNWLTNRLTNTHTDTHIPPLKSCHSCQSLLLSFIQSRWCPFFHWITVTQQATGQPENSFQRKSPRARVNCSRLQWQPLHRVHWWRHFQNFARRSQNWNHRQH